jgi:Zn-finger nucleic acid-binding protein
MDVYVCPACDGATTQKTFPGRLGAAGEGDAITIDECRGCKGIWFDEMEIEETIGARTPVAELAQAPALGSGCRSCGDEPGSDPERCRSCGARPRINCARCKTTMNVVMIMGIRVDVCPTCSGIFLDQGELKALSNAYSEHYETASADSKLKCPGCGELVAYDETLYGADGMVCNSCFQNSADDDWKHWHQLSRPTGLLWLLLGVFKRNKAN